MHIRFLRYIVIDETSFRPGDVAQVDRGAELVASGKATPIAPTTATPQDVRPNITDLSYRDLQAAAKRLGIPANQSRAALIEALS